MARHARHPGPGRGRLHGRQRRRRRAATSSACTTRTPGPSCTSRAPAGWRSSRPRAGRLRAAAVGPGGRRRRRTPSRRPEPERDVELRPVRRPRRQREPSARGHRPGGPQPGQRRWHRRRPGPGPVLPFVIGVGAAAAARRPERDPAAGTPPALERRATLRRLPRWPPGPTCRTPWSTTATRWDPSDPPRRGAARLTEERHLVGEPAEACTGWRPRPSGPATPRR